MAHSVVSNTMKYETILYSGWYECRRVAMTQTTGIQQLKFANLYSWRHTWRIDISERSPVLQILHDGTERG